MVFLTNKMYLAIVTALLEVFKEKVSSDLFEIKDREKNNSFISRYKLSNEVIKKILLNIKVEDFVEMRDDFEDRNQKIFIFISDQKIGIPPRVVSIYANANDEESVVIISLHEAEYPTQYVFR